MEKFGIILFGAALVLAVSPIQGRQQYRSSIPNGNGIPCPPEDQHCEENELCHGVGHETCAGGVVSPKRNPFGQDFQAVGLKWTKDLCEKDSDGDGFSNGYELGDPCCVWEQGVDVPKWMRDWPVSHPGFAKSTQIPDEDIDLEKLCKKVDHLSKKNWYNEGEDQITQEYFIKEHTIPNEETIYSYIHFNFPDDQTYYVVGTDTIIDNEELVHHYVIRACTEKFDEEKVGKPVDFAVRYEEMDLTCEEALFIWAPGADQEIPKVASFPVGKGTNRVGFEVEMHYDNPLLKKGETDASGIRFHMTTNPRKYEAGILWTGGIISVGVIPPKTKTYSSTIFQVKVDEKIAPDGLVLFEYFPHMHLLGRRMWTEKLRRKSGSTDMLEDLSELEKVEDLARDDAWTFDNQRMIRTPSKRIKNGDYIATTCLYDSDERDEVTVGNIGSYDEMCMGSFAFYPAKAVDFVLFHSGPRFFGEITDEEFRSLRSVTEILEFPSVDTQLPTWRRAYLNGELECNEEKIGDVPITYKGVYASENYAEEIAELCGEEIAVSLDLGNDLVEKTKCSTECAEYVFNILGCGLLKEGKASDGEIFPLYPSNMEIAAEELCGEAFLEYYLENKRSRETEKPNRG